MTDGKKCTNAHIDILHCYWSFISPSYHSARILPLLIIVLCDLPLLFHPSLSQLLTHSPTPLPPPPPPPLHLHLLTSLHPSPPHLPPPPPPPLPLFVLTGAKSTLLSLIRDPLVFGHLLRTLDIASPAGALLYGMSQSRSPRQRCRRMHHVDK